MPGIDYATAAAKLALWLDAEGKIALGQTVAVEGRTLARADLGAVREQLEYWNRYCQRLAPPEALTAVRPRPMVQRAVVLDGHCSPPESAA